MRHSVGEFRLYAGAMTVLNSWFANNNGMFRFAGALEGYDRSQIFIHGNTSFERNTASVEGGDFPPVNG